MIRNSIAVAGFSAIVTVWIAGPAGATPETVLHPTESQPAQKIVPFDGVWEGTIVFDREALLTATGTPAAGIPMRIEIHDAVVRVFVKDGNDYSEAKPGLFHIAPVSANAVIFATQESPEDGWVESWVFVVTQKNEHTLIVEYSRLVNNVGTPLSDPNSKFGTRGMGEFELVSGPHTP